MAQMFPTSENEYDVTLTKQRGRIIKALKGLKMITYNTHWVRGGG